MGKVKVDNGLLQGLAGLGESWPQQMPPHDYDILFQESRAESVAVADKRAAASAIASHLPPTCRPHGKATTENKRERQNEWERERASANRQHFSFIKAKKAFLRGACRHDSQSTKRHCEKFPNHNSWQGACKTWRSLKFQLTQVSCLHSLSLSLSYSHSLRSLELRLHLSSLLWTQLWSLFLFAFG